MFETTVLKILSCKVTYISTLHTSTPALIRSIKISLCHQVRKIVYTFKLLVKQGFSLLHIPLAPQREMHFIIYQVMWAPEMWAKTAYSCLNWGGMGCISSPFKSQCLTFGCVCAL